MTSGTLPNIFGPLLMSAVSPSLTSVLMVKRAGEYYLSVPSPWLEKVRALAVAGGVYCLQPKHLLCVGLAINCHCYDCYDYYDCYDCYEESWLPARGASHATADLRCLPENNGNLQLLTRPDMMYTYMICVYRSATIYFLMQYAGADMFDNNCEQFLGGAPTCRAFTPASDCT